MPTPSPAPLNPDVEPVQSADSNANSSADNAKPLRRDELAQWLTRLAGGQASIADVLAAVCPNPQELRSNDSTHDDPATNGPATNDPAPNNMAPIDGATVDLGRQQRCGFGEVIYGEGKSSDLLQRITRVQIDAGQNVLITRITDASAAEVVRPFHHTHHNATARTLRISGHPIQASSPITDLSNDHVAVVTAGSTDGPVAEEAIETLTWMGVAYQRFDDIGVAGPQRLVAAVPRLQRANAVIVIAGMEGALPSVVSGHLSVPIFAVPTSVGYGATLGGLTPLLGMLSSCAAGVAVVNIDAGFKAGYLAGLVIDQINKATHRQHA